MGVSQPFWTISGPAPAQHVGGGYGRGGGVLCAGNSPKAPGQLGVLAMELHGDPSAILVSPACT